MRDDLSKLPLPKSAKRYARMTSKTLGSDWSKKVGMYIDAAAELTNQKGRKKGFANQDDCPNVPHSMKEGVEWDDNLSWQSNVYAQFNGHQPENAGQLSFWLEREGREYEAQTGQRWWWDEATFHQWLADKLAIRKTMAESIVDRLLEMDFNQEPEGIRAAAVQTRSGKLYTGAAHWEACMKANQAGEDWSDEDLGFVTTGGRFVDRQEAEMIGARMGQLQKTIEDPSMVHAREFTHYL